MVSLRTTASLVFILALAPASVMSTGVFGQEQKDAKPGVVRKSSDELLNSAISRTAPAYPEWAERAGSPTAVIKVVVGENGSTMSAGQVSGDRLLGWSAIEALRKWRWQPTLQDGRPARALGRLSFALAPDGSVTAGSDTAGSDTARVSDDGPPTDYELLSPGGIAQFKDDGKTSRLFEQSPEVAVRITDSNEQPVFVEQARVWTGKPKPTQSASLTDGSLMRVILVLRNTTDKRVTFAHVRFTNWQGHTSFVVWARSKKGDAQAYYPLIVSEMSVSGDPAAFEVEVESVEFEGGGSWASNKPPPGAELSATGIPPAPGGIPPPTIPVPGEIHPPTIVLPGVPTTVDSRPRALNNPRPSYTEEARRNGVMGTSRVRVLVGADGSVKQVRVLTFLPDGLTEETIRAAYQIKFKPAMKDGEPVAFWQAVDVDFNLR